MTAQVELTPTKLALRRTVKAQRQAHTPRQREEVARALAAVGLELPRVRHASCVALYASLADEPGTELLRAGLRDLRVRVLLPIVPADPDDRVLDWAQDTGEELDPAGPLALPEPAGPRLGPGALAAAQVVIAPALAVDTSGTRLGRGRGYYDGALAGADPAALVLVVVHDQELLDAGTTPIPREPHDVPVQGVITPTRWMFFAPGVSSGFSR
jgi:5-formyltetrahydrofolate cyclo-ligase